MQNKCDDQCVKKGVDLSGGIGFWEIIGYDEANGKDITNFHVNTITDKALRDKGIIKNNILKVSPFFNKEFNQDQNRKNIAVWTS